MNGATPGVVRFSNKPSVTIKVNPGYDCEYPKAQYPFIVWVSLGNHLSCQWSFCKTRQEAETVKAQYEDCL